MTVSDSADFDLFGGTTHAHNGIRLSMPLGGYKYMKNTKVKFKTEPFGRDIGQALETPLPLYELTRPFSYDHMIKHWHQIVGKKNAVPRDG